jgi:hypothetical protein
MDDPTRRCENDTDNETHSPRPPIPSGGLTFFRTEQPYSTSQLNTRPYYRLPV